MAVTKIKISPTRIAFWWRLRSKTGLVAFLRVVLRPLLRDEPLERVERPLDRLLRVDELDLRREPVPPRVVDFFFSAEPSFAAPFFTAPFFTVLFLVVELFFLVEVLFLVITVAWLV